ncbi:hypothetical protein [Uliginosibacterium gangwonense]|uniref:hypothetical protein n=1 Tax=Uliginosibacterium gangwonense TaxID=392736 RepID=UPI0012F75932|nr:hypothetical protein [Uliginosibacterium gangwonense]
MKKITICLLLVLTSCVTLDDFKQMSAQQRAETVCSKQQVLRNIDSKIAALQNSIDGSRNALARGYRVPRECHEIEIPGDTKITNCTKTENQVQCVETRPKRYKTECTETPVAMDSAQEKENIRGWSAEIDSLRFQRKDKYQQCYNQIYPLSPEEAYKYY